MSPSPPNFDPQGLYSRLGVDPTASHEAIVTAYRRKARVFHPDVAGTGNVDAFVAVKTAYDLLSDPRSRAAYDRAAQQTLYTTSPTENQRSSAAALRAGPVRQPRISDLPMVVWIGMAVFLTAGLAEVAVHLRGQTISEPVIEIPANAPVVPPAPAVPSQTTVSNPAPVTLIGIPNYYTIPAAGPTLLWRRDDLRNALVSVGVLPPFSSVQALRFFQRSGMMEVRLNGTINGYIRASRLTPGDVAAARRAYCGYGAGSPPANGEVLIRNASGSGHLTLVNRASQPVVVKLRYQNGDTAVAVFLAPNGQIHIDNLPMSRFRLDYAVGELWSRSCGIFAAGMRAQRVSGYHSLNELTPLRIPPDGLGAISIEDIQDRDFQRD